MVHWPFPHDVQAIQRIDAVTSVLDIVCRTTGMGFAAVAWVIEERWIACAVKDDIQFGLKPGGELKVETTICHKIRQSGTPVIIDHVAQDQAFCGHPTPAMYGFQSYISVPIVRADGTFFGTLCAIDPRPAVLKECDLMVPKSVYCDAGRIGQLLNLLAANALIHGSATSPILVYARSDEKAFELSVHTQRGCTDPTVDAGKALSALLSRRCEVEPRGNGAQHGGHEMGS
jgi:GAF domain